MNEQSKSCYSGVRTNNGSLLIVIGGLVDCFSIGKSEQLSKSERIFLIKNSGCYLVYRPNKVRIDFPIDKLLSQFRKAKQGNVLCGSYLSKGVAKSRSVNANRSRQHQYSSFTSSDL